MSLSTWHQRVIRDERTFCGDGARAVLRRLSKVYGFGVGLRNRWFDGGRERRLDVPVISVGNITTGGTGKTPVVIDLVARLMRRGLKTAVVSRGYRAGPDGRNDEQAIIERRCPGVINVGDPDRVRGGTLAIQRDRANVIVLDDAFQHRRVHRDLDIVVIDATCPFGHGHLLPRGLLREPPSGLSRAGLIVLSRSDQVDSASLERAELVIKAHAPSAPIVRSRHAVSRIVGLDEYTRGVTHSVRSPEHESPGFVSADDRNPLSGRRVVCFAGIGNPAAFRRTVESLGAHVVGDAWWPDHHHYLPGDVTDLLRPERFPEFDLLVTTEKDAVKLAGLAPLPMDLLRVVTIDVVYDADGAATIDAAIARALGTV